MEITSYEILKSVQGPFHEGNVELFGETAGRQCACNALFSLCWAFVKKISLWKFFDLDNILIKDDKI